ncbi:MAG TPA: MFS transporter [Prosthecobacter sp.]|nr:MFS transporter [Prosthecobacter sp.]
MQTALKVKLSIFMFLQYFIWGSWYVSLALYLGTLKFEGGEVGWCYGAFAIGSMISPFFVGLIADRYFASQKMLAVLGIAGGVVMFLLPRFTTFGSLFPMLILYCALYAPTLALGNSLALTHLADPKTGFPRVKLWSAVGWIAGGSMLSLVLHGERSPIQFYLAGSVSVLLGLYSLALPHTPPKKTEAHVTVGDLLGLDALALLRKPAFAVFILCMFLICIPLYFYFVMMGQYLGELKWEAIAFKMTFAQYSDIAFMFMLPIMLKTLGYKKTIFMGILAWVLRYFALAGSVNALTMAAPLIFAAILLHGVCYDFLFIAGQLYVDDEANERIRGACQGFIAFILWGVGNFVGTQLAGRVMENHAIKDAAGLTVGHDWQQIWLIPAYLAAGVLVIFLIFFRNPARAKNHEKDVIAGRKEENLELP